MVGFRGSNDMPVQPPTVWARIPVAIRAVVIGIAIGMIAANVWPALLLSLGVPLATVGELLFLAVYIYWAAGGGPPKSLRTVRADSFRVSRLSTSQWCWGLIAAAAFAATIHAAIVVLFRIVPFPATAFHHGYDFSFIPTRPLQWLACVISALSAAACEETGFRGYMQRPIEERHGPAIAIAISSLFFMLVHLNKDWSLIGMVPIVFGAGVLLGWMAYASGTLVFGMIGHTIMDIGLFSYWWTQIAGTFSERPVSETGVDSALVVECAALVLLVAITLGSIGKLRHLQHTPA
jgi:membrane protease YdiL (CAAX protease family)